MPVFPNATSVQPHQSSSSSASSHPNAPLPDLDNAERIGSFIDRFYRRVLQDPLLAPVFLEQAGIDIEEHLPRIKAYWRKMLLGEDVYRCHMMQKHRDLDAAEPLRLEHYQRWLALFEATLGIHHSGPLSERAGMLARRVAGNMRRNLERFRA